MEAKENYLYRPAQGNEADIARLIEQHNALAPIFKLFSPYFQPHGDETVLDIGCGPGSWAIDVAFNHTSMSIIGLDINASSVNYAMARAKSEQVENVSFEVHDITQGLPFRDESVDYINICLANSFLLSDQWPKLFAECHRILRPAGWLRSIETQSIQTSSHAGRQLWNLYNQALEKDGRRYVELAPFLVPLLTSARLLHRPFTVHAADFSEHSPLHRVLSQNWYVGAHLATPFVIRQDVVSKAQLQQLIQEMQKDMMLPGFYALIFYTDISAQKPT